MKFGCDTHDSKPASAWPVRTCNAVAANVLACLLVSLSAVLAPANARPQQSALVIDANTGAIVSAQAADESRYPASLTKMMTLYVVFDLIEQGRLTYQTRIPVSETAASQPPSRLGLEAGSDIAVIDAVKALITKSANDIAVAIAEKIAGSEDKFASLMTQKARAIGMKNSTFKNASGLPNDQQVTTARDMVTLALRLHDDFPKHYPLFATREFRYNSATHANHNALLGKFEGTEGIKTGYTRVSGFNLVSSVKRGQKHVVGVVFGGATAGSRNQTMRTLLNIALLKASTHRTRQSTVAVARARPTPEPKIAERQKHIAPSAVGLAVAQTANIKQVSTAAVPEAAPAPPASKIEIAKVRPILVAPRQPRQAALPPTEAMPVSTTPVSIAAVQPAAMAPPANVILPPLAAAAAHPEPTRATGPKTRAAAIPVERAAPAHVVARSPMATINTQVVPAVGAAGRGNPPGTLGQQAAALSGAASAPTPQFVPGRMAAGAPVLSATSGGSGQFQIQIGAFATAAEAERQLNVIKHRAADLVGNASTKAIPAESAGKQFWRARFGGFDTSSATHACTELRRRQIDCLVTRAQ